MTPEQLINFLNKEYSIKGIIDLEELTKSPQSAYQFFYSLYQSEFATSDRIVIYTSADIPDNLLRHLYHVANFVDISNWFVLFCTGTDISPQLISTAEQYSSDPVPFQHVKVDIEQTSILKEQYHLPDTICAVPWMHLEIVNDGAITPCCMSSDIVLGNIKSTRLDDAFHSDSIRELRKQFLAGEKPKACASCWKNEDIGLSSIRMHNIKRLKKQFVL
jgi:radical SAM protein with 4Fe4S-binding SPASM domain